MVMKRRTFFGAVAAFLTAGVATLRAKPSDPVGFRYHVNGPEYFVSVRGTMTDVEIDTAINEMRRMTAGKVYPSRATYWDIPQSRTK